VRRSDNLNGMVNAELRVQAAYLIRSYLDGKIDNLEFADTFPRDKRDPALAAIYRRLWFHYDDLKSHRCQFAPHSAPEILFRRCALFLDTNLEYQWPKLWHHGLAHPIVRLLSGEVFRSRAIEESKSAGEYSVWPFSQKADLDKAKVDFDAQDVTLDVKSFVPPLNRRDRVSMSILQGIDFLLTTLFVAAVGGLVWALIGHRIGMAACFVCILAYLLVIGARWVILKLLATSHSDRLNVTSPD
jgi:hypothetical protein